jgi:restriction system protein
MAVPKYHELTRPLLDFLSDGDEHNLREASQALAERLKLTEVDLAETVPSGYPKFMHRLGWAKYDLAKAGLVETVSRGIYRITDFGREQLPMLPPRIDRRYLASQGLGDWGSTPQENAPVSEKQSTEAEETPDEQIDRASAELEQALSENLLSRLKALSASSFERFVVELITAMGYGIGEVTGRSGDGGIDGVIYQDRLRLDRVFLQAKRWAEQPVRSPDINGFIGALARQGATRGVFVTTSRYTGDAISAAQVAHLRIKLIDGLELAKLAIEYNIGVSTRRKLEIKRVDSDYFDELDV